MAHTIEVTIDAQGAVTVEAKGVQGGGCGALTKALETALGKTTADVKKPEYFQSAGGVHAQQK